MSKLFPHQVTIKRNWKKKIRQICNYDGYVQSFNLGNGFTGIPFIPEDMKTFVERENNNHRGSRLTYDKDSGLCRIHVHSNQWYEWTNKINW